MVTAAITTSAFYTRIFATLTSHLDLLAKAGNTTNELPFPILGNLSCADISNPETHLRPEGFVPQLIVTSSPWIDLTSPDPLIADISRQVLLLEVQYAAFCGASNILVRGPPLNRCARGGLTSFARAINEALSAGPFVQIHLSFPMGRGNENESDIFSLASHSRKQYVPTVREDEDVVQDELGSWEAWNVIRSIVTYNTRLSVGKNKTYFVTPYCDLVLAMSCD